MLDSSFFVAEERRGKNIVQLLRELEQRFPTGVFALSVVSIAELAPGAIHARTQALKAVCERFLNDLIEALPVYAVTSSVALAAGRLQGELALKGFHVGLADLLIGATALELGFAVATHNLRHFRLVPGLNVVASKIT